MPPTIAQELDIPVKREALRVTSCSFYPSTVKRIDELAAAEGITRSEYLRWIVETFVSKMQ